MTAPPSTHVSGTAGPRLPCPGHIRSKQSSTKLTVSSHSCSNFSLMGCSSSAAIPHGYGGRAFPLLYQGVRSPSCHLLSPSCREVRRPRHHELLC